MKFFEDLLGGQRRADAINIMYFKPWARHIVTQEEGDAMIRPMDRAEIEEALFDIHEDKAPVLNGFSSGCFKAAWPIVGDEITAAVQDFFHTGKLLKQVNATVLSLIPKVASPNIISEFRPITCYNVLYKVITKIIVRRMHGVMDKIVSPVQNAFVPGRHISSNILQAQELFFGYNHQNLQPRCALIVDLRKAYDTLEWDFILMM
ncbi:UNVERIFIED_CONTAM: hypothetical protein Sradi_5259600 [Sesamum radiatum]|uniref:Reverse transcriptase domain-containing protein n=1 Tax=Sesamum radiatum TaxID=300843 RepID=A0AAW2LLP8_SESRA